MADHTADGHAGTGRTAAGRFAAGNRFGRGRPPRPREVAYLRKLVDTVSLRDWADIAKKAVEDAKGGDTAARNWLSLYLLGRDPPSIARATAEEVAEGDYWALVCAVAQLGSKVFLERRLDHSGQFGDAEDVVEGHFGQLVVGEWVRDDGGVPEGSVVVTASLAVLDQLDRWATDEALKARIGALREELARQADPPPEGGENG
jgi:hypothetical protein